MPPPPEGMPPAPVFFFGTSATMASGLRVEAVRVLILFEDLADDDRAVLARVDDAMHATRAAVEEGILPGGGVALLRASEHLKGIRTKNDDQKTGVEIVRKALSYPARQTARSSSGRSSKRISTHTASTRRPANMST